MSDNYQNSIRLQRDGTSRQQRLLEALLPDYVKIDERGMKDLIIFAQKLAGEIMFFGEDGSVKAGVWEHFFSVEKDKDLDILFDENKDGDSNYLDYVKLKSGKTEPHIALFLAFLKLFRIAQDDLNKIGKKHIDFYYKDVLQIRERPAIADQVFVIFKLAKHVRDAHVVPKSSELKTGLKDAAGKPILYETVRDMTVNHGEVGQLKSVFFNHGSGKDCRLYASPVANSPDGSGGEFENDEISWKVFGGPDRPQADIGFAVASPTLYMAEGFRTVTLRLQFEKSTETAQALQKLSYKGVPFAKHAFRVMFSGEEDWIVPAGEDLVHQEKQVHPEIIKTISDVLHFVNTADAKAIAAKVKDHPDRGYSKVGPGYGIGITVAKNIVKCRKDKGFFNAVSELLDVKGLGTDKVDDLIYTFRKRAHSTKVRADEGTITIVRTLDESQPGVTGYNAGVLGDPVSTKWPVMKVLLNKGFPVSRKGGEFFPYEYLAGLNLVSLHMRVDVTGVKNNILQNDSGSLDPGKPLQPFGNRPVLGSSFYIGNWEIFQKNLHRLWLNLKWHDLPKEVSLGEYYESYDTPGGTRKNNSFKAEVSILEKRKWKSVDDNVQLFSFADVNSPVDQENTIKTDCRELKNLERNPGLQEFTVYDTGTQRGFIRLMLKGMDFGHKDYGPSYAKAVINAVDNGGEPDLPKEPYTPVINELTIDYMSEISMKVPVSAVGNGAGQIDRFFHIYPFGATEPGKTDDNVTFLPVFTSEGTLYIGLDNFTGGRNISILFQVAEGSADPDYTRQPVNWSYLAADRWEQFNDRQILSDSTNQLLSSGIISFSIPRKASTMHTMLPAGLVWLRASVDKDTPAISRLTDIRAQAVKAKYKGSEGGAGHLAESLPAETISKLKESDSAIQEIVQPFASFGGSAKEESSAFYTRVSERLRHKRRAITIWDYERLVLQQFPSIYKVKCLNHTYFKGTTDNYSEIAPGHVSLIMVSDMINKNAVDPLKPRTSLIMLAEIEDYLNKIKNENVRLHVSNPLYEEIKVSFYVRFREGTDSGYYQEVLNQEIKSFLSPWAFRNTPDVVFGGRIHKSKILHFIEKRPYVDFVTCFRMMHLVPDSAPGFVKEEKDEAEATTAASVLGSAPEHIIVVIDEEPGPCEDNKVSAFRELNTDSCG